MQMVKINKVGYTTQPPPNTISRFSLTFVHWRPTTFFRQDQTTKLRVIRKHSCKTIPHGSGKVN